MSPTEELGIDRLPMESSHRASWIDVPLKVVDVSKRFGNAQVLKNVTLDMAPGETLVILGDSGCGKTTLLRILAGLQEADSGEIYFRNSISNSTARNRNVIYLDQEALLFEHLNVFDNIAFAPRLAKRPKAEIHQRVTELLCAVQLENQAHKRSWQISGGQKQRVAFARAILANPQILLLDEPFCSLDSRSRTSMQELYRQLRAKYAITSIFVTHDVKEALEVGDRFAFMSHGTLRLYPSRKEFIDDEATGVREEIQFWQQTTENPS